MSDEHENGKKTRKISGDEMRDAQNNITIERLLSETGRNWKVAISRVKPKWCAGWLETVAIDTDTPISMDYIKEEWGGEYFRIRILDEKGVYQGATNISIAEVPKKYGQRIKSPTEIEEEREAKRMAMLQPQNNTAMFAELVKALKPEPQPAPPDNTNLLTQFMGMLAAANAQNISILQDSLDKQQRLAEKFAKSKDETVHANPMDQFKQAVDLVSQLDQFRTSVTPSENAAESLISPDIKDLLKTVMEYYAPKMQPKRKSLPSQNGPLTDKIGDLAREFRTLPNSAKHDVMQSFFKEAGMEDMYDFEDEDDSDNLNSDQNIIENTEIDPSAVVEQKSQLESTSDRGIINVDILEGTPAHDGSKAHVRTASNNRA